MEILNRSKERFERMLSRRKWLNINITVNSKMRQESTWRVRVRGRKEKSEESIPTMALMVSLVAVHHVVSGVT